jgi:hypothetical protein
MRFLILLCLGVFLPCVAQAQRLPAPVLPVTSKGPVSPAGAGAAPSRLPMALQPSSGTHSVDAMLKRAPSGLKGALIGAGVGAIVGGVAVFALCDVQNCLTHPDTGRILLIGISSGAVLGYLADLVMSR